MTNSNFTATGRRKTAVAKIRLFPGQGNRTVNGRKVDEYFTRASLITYMEGPLAVTNNSVRFDVIADVSGGGMTGQAGAIRLGIARALVEADAETRKPLRVAGHLTRDSRMVERKKYGRAGARRRFQFSKR
jgi:small subunit ribosomal protein S9